MTIKNRYGPAQRVFCTDLGMRNLNRSLEVAEPPVCVDELARNEIYHALEGTVSVVNKQILTMSTDNFLKPFPIFGLGKVSESSSHLTPA